MYLIAAAISAAASNYHDNSVPTNTMMISILVYTGIRVKVFPYVFILSAVMIISYTSAQLGYNFAKFVSAEILTYIGFITCTQIIASIVLYSIERQYRVSFVYLMRRDDETQRASMEHERSEKLLANILPKAYIDRVRKDNLRFVHHYEFASVLFSDIASFTKWSSVTGAADVVKILNIHFSLFDSVAAKLGLEKVSSVCYNCFTCCSMLLLNCFWLENENR